MKGIGGYLGLEIGEKNLDYPFLNNPGVNSGRHALELILMKLHPKPKTIYLPLYTCSAVFEPLHRLGINYKFYRVDENLEIENHIMLKEDEYIIVNNYFGIKDQYIQGVTGHYLSKLIVDSAQAFFSPRIGSNKMFFSPRKFIGVADGGYTWPPYETDTIDNIGFSADKSIHLLRRLDSGAESGFREFQRDENILKNEPLCTMSELTKAILESVNCERIIERRRRNFEVLHVALASKNKLNIPDWNHFSCPMVYPFWTDIKNLRKKLIENKIFVAMYWPELLRLCEEDSIEYELTCNLMPLPIDQRYDECDMNRIIELINA